ncbi:hypothetical protein [Pelistega indica]|nr:hypothetical protein [Pelistega indica]
MANGDAWKRPKKVEESELSSDNSETEEKLKTLVIAFSQEDVRQKILKALNDNLGAVYTALYTQEGSPKSGLSKALKNSYSFIPQDE